MATSVTAEPKTETAEILETVPHWIGGKAVESASKAFAESAGCGDHLGAWQGHG
jgi:hypothetical protein